MYVGDVCLPSSDDAEGVMVLGLRVPSDRMSLGRNQFAMSRGPTCIAWASWLTLGLPAECRLWPGSLTRFRQMFTALLAFL